MPLLGLNNIWWDHLYDWSNLSPEWYSKCSTKTSLPLFTTARAILQILSMVHHGSNFGTARTGLLIMIKFDWLHEMTTLGDFPWTVWGNLWHILMKYDWRRVQTDSKYKQLCFLHTYLYMWMHWTPHRNVQSATRTERDSIAHCFALIREFLLDHKLTECKELCNLTWRYLLK